MADLMAKICNNDNHLCSLSIFSTLADAASKMKTLPSDEPTDT